MARTAKRPSRRKGSQSDTVLHRGAEAVGSWVTHNPALVGGTTAFLIALSFVSANAIWYQPHAHTAPFFATRSFQTTAAVHDAAGEDATTIRLERPAVPLPSVKPAPPPMAARDPAIERVQAILKNLGYYKGDVDGIPGPNTATAISAYQRKMGLTVSGRVDKTLLSELGANDVTGSIGPAAPGAEDAPAQGAPAPSTPEIVSRIQQGLKAFGNDGIDADGVVGKKTRDGIRQFQALFGLEETGEPSQEVYRKMLAEGLLE